MKFKNGFYVGLTMFTLLVTTPALAQDVKMLEAAKKEGKAVVYGSL